jgi:hypothetical protein
MVCTICPLNDLLVKIFERHRSEGNLEHVRPWGEKFRDGLMEYDMGIKTRVMLWYKRFDPAGTFGDKITSQAVVIDYPKQ